MTAPSTITWQRYELRPDPEEPELWFHHTSDRSLLIDVWHAEDGWGARIAVLELEGESHGRPDATKALGEALIRLRYELKRYENRLRELFP
jgi:hypothetical protein